MRIAVTRSTAYGAGARQGLDVYRRRGADGAPVVVFFYGGGWRSGSKGLYGYIGKMLARRGYVTVLPNYRIYPEVRYPVFLEDGALALRWVKDNAAHFGGDAGKVFVMGHSAGAHIAAMLATDPRWLAAVDLAPERDIAGLVGIAGPYDFVPLRDQVLRDIFGGDRPETQPIYHAGAGTPPSLLLTGVRDAIVDPGNSERFAARLKAAGTDATVLKYPRVGHYLIIAAFARLGGLLAPVLRDSDRFMRRIARIRL